MTLAGTHNYGVALQPCGLGAPSQHFEKTVRGGIDLDQFAGAFTEANLHRLKEWRNSDSRLALWGLTRSAHQDQGNATSNLSKWGQLTRGTLVCFVQRNEIIATGRLLGRLHDPAAAGQIWSLKDGLPFEYMFALTDVSPCRIELGPLKSRAGVEPRFAVQSLSFPDEDAVELLLDAIGSELVLRPSSDAGGQGVHPPTFTEDETDDQVVAKRRREQRALRDHLIARDGAVCVLCGAETPAEFLWAAHIKKRSVCTSEERRDLAHIAFLACRFGCDDLFERGYVGVTTQGNLALSEQLPAALRRLGHVRLLETRSADAPLAGLAAGPSGQYLRWHWENTFRRTL